jgi:hypothetical protein
MGKDAKPAKPAATEKRVTEYALSKVLPDGTRQGLFSHEDGSLVQMRKAQLALDGQTGLVVTKRDCRYPLSDDGNVIHHQSSVEETDLA